MGFYLMSLHRNVVFFMPDIINTLHLVLIASSTAKHMCYTWPLVIRILRHTISHDPCF